MARILVTRAGPDAEETGALLRAAGHVPVLAPLRRVEMIDAVLPSLPNALVATSRNAFAGPPLPEEWRALPLFVVGDASAKAAGPAGFSAVTALGGDAAGLVLALKARMRKDTRFAYLAGEPRTAVIEEGLREAGFGVEIILRYRMTQIETFPDHAAEAIRKGEVDAVLHFSFQSARAFLDLAEAVGLTGAITRLAHLCLSDAIAALAEARLGPAAVIRVAARPDQSALIAALHACPVSRTP